MSWFSSFMHPEKGYKEAQKEMEKYYNEGQGYQQPYNTAGQSQIGNLQNYINTLMDPQALQDKWSKGYNESDAAKYNEGMATQHGLNAASSMGLMGSQPALSAIQSGTSGIVAEDKQKYLDDLMQKYMQGAGLSQGMFNTGATTAGQMGNNAMTMGQNSGNNAYGKTNAGGDMFGKLVGTGAGVLGSWLGGGVGGNTWHTGGR